MGILELRYARRSKIESVSRLNARTIYRPLQYARAAMDINMRQGNIIRDIGLHFEGLTKFIKATYLYFDMDPDNNHDLIIQIYKFNDDGVKEIDCFVVEPVVDVMFNMKKSF